MNGVRNSAIAAKQPPVEPSTAPSQENSVIVNIFYTVISPFTAVYHCIFPINPVTKAREFRLIPTCVERWIGRAAYRPLIATSGGEISRNHPLYGRYVDIVKNVGAKLAANSPRKDLEFEFVVIDSSVDNAWCLPGGKIGINRGLIEHMEAESKDYGLGVRPSLEEKIAAVLSHEITHAAARHGGRKMEFSLFLYAVVQAVKYALSYFIRSSYDKQIEEAKGNPELQLRLQRQKEDSVNNFAPILNELGSWLVGGINLCSSRSHELEADKYGMHLLADAKDEQPFNKNTPIAAVWLMHFFKEHHSAHTGHSCIDWITSWFRSHPAPEERLEANRVTWQTLSTTTCR